MMHNNKYWEYIMYIQGLYTLTMPENEITYKLKTYSMYFSRVLCDITLLWHGLFLWWQVICLPGVACFDSLKFNQWLEFHLIQLLYRIWKLTSAEPKSTMSCALIYIYGS